MPCSAFPMITSKPVPSNYTVRSCSITSAPTISQTWENHSLRLSATLDEGIPVLPSRTSSIEGSWVVVSLELQSFKIDIGSDDTCPALSGPNPLIADLLPYCLTNSSRNELQGGRYGSSRTPSTISSTSLSTGNEFAWCGKECVAWPGFLVGLLLPPFWLWLLLLQTLYRLYRRLKPKVPAGKTRVRWECVS